MEAWMLVVAILGSLLASTGFWAFIMKKMEKKNAVTRLALGICHDRILYLGLLYSERGYITRDEFINLHDGLYLPYKELGGNGATERIMKQVEGLPIQRLGASLEQKGEKR